jgi:hypothetical protein
MKCSILIYLIVNATVPGTLDFFNLHFLGMSECLGLCLKLHPDLIFSVKLRPQT